MSTYTRSITRKMEEMKTKIDDILAIVTDGKTFSL